MSGRLGIIGYPIGHSISPIFQQAALEHCFIEARYQAWEVEPRNLSGFIATLRSPETLGINVTVPHKEAVMAYLDHVDPWALSAGAVNTIVNEDGRLDGHNTDGAGFLRALVETAGFQPQGCKVLILGAGGSAKAVALALAREGVASITIANRTLGRAEDLARLVEKHNLRADAIPLNQQDMVLARAAAASDLLVNCTTLGMKHGPDEAGSPLSSGMIPTGVLAYDLVYNPPETPFLREATVAGARTLGGLPMLVYQGAESFQLWTGKEAPVEVMLKAAEAALE